MELVEEYNNTVAVFTCGPDHTLTGGPVLGCVDGKKWNGTSPQCIEIVRDSPGTSSTSSWQSPGFHSLANILLASLLASLL